MHRITFRFQQEDSPHGYKATRVTHIGIRDEEGKWIKFAKHTPELVEFLQAQEFVVDIPDDLIS